MLLLVSVHLSLASVRAVIEAVIEVSSTSSNVYEHGLMISHLFKPNN